MREFLASSFARWMVPDHILLVNEVPKTSVGKYDKKRVRAMLETGGLDQVRKEIGLPTSTAV